MGVVYASVSDITAIGRTLTTAQESAAATLLEQASALLRLEAYNVGKSIDGMIAAPETGGDFALVVKNVVVSAVCRALDAAEESTGYESASETLGPYQYTYKYGANIGEILYFKKSELQRLGLANQTVGWADLYGVFPPEVG